jgi:hypothetical protein
VAEQGEDCSWLSSESLTRDETKAQRELAFATANVLAELALSEEKLMQSKSLD